MKTVKAIVEEYLRANGYDGLCSEDCGCDVNDLMVAYDCPHENCEVAHKQICKDEESEWFGETTYVPVREGKEK